MASKAQIGGIMVGAAVVAGACSYVLFGSTTQVTPEAVESTTTSTTEAVAQGVPQPIYFSSDEIPLGPAVLVPNDVVVSGSEVSIQYDLHHLAPVDGLPGGAVFIPFQGFAEVSPEEAETVFPSAWTIVVDGTEIRGTVANPRARAARFTVPDGTTTSQIESARIDSYLIQIPVDLPFRLTLANPTAEILPGVSASLIQVSEQADTTIVRVEISVTDPLNLGSIDVHGQGEGSIVSVREAEGGPVWNLTFAGGPSDGYDMALVGSMWIAVEGRWDVRVGSNDG